jgi:hypothetical protein
MSTKITPIVRGNMVTLRADVTKAVQDVMAKHGLKANVGRIVFEPGREFRCKLTVLQPMGDVPAGAGPKFGETWKFGRTTYTIVSVNDNYVIGSRFSNTRRFGRVERQYRIQLQDMLRAGVKVSR